MKKILVFGLMALSLNAFSQAETGIQNSGGLSCYNVQGNLCIPKPANSQGCANGQALIESKHCRAVISYCQDNKILCDQSIEQVFVKLSIRRY